MFGRHSGVSVSPSSVGVIIADSQIDCIYSGSSKFSFLLTGISADPRPLTFALSDAEIWVQGHEVYKISVLYNFIIDLFEVPDLDPKVKE